MLQNFCAPRSNANDRPTFATAPPATDLAMMLEDVGNLAAESSAMHPAKMFDNAPLSSRVPTFDTNGPR